MKTITVSSNFGRFSYTATALVDLNEPVSKTLDRILKEGIASLCFRAGGSAAEKALVEAKLMTKEQKRAEVPYSDAAKDVLQASFDKQVKDLALENFEVKFSGEHTYNDSAASRARAEKAYAQYLGADDKGKMAMEVVFGFDGQDAREEIVEAIHVYFSALQEPRKKKGA